MRTLRLLKWLVKAVGFVSAMAFAFLVVTPGVFLGCAWAGFRIGWTLGVEKTKELAS